MHRSSPWPTPRSRFRGRAGRPAGGPGPTAAALSAGSLAAFVPPPGATRLLIAADRDAAGQRAAATLEARALAQGLAALGPQALAARLGHGMM